MEKEKQMEDIRQFLQITDKGVIPNSAFYVREQMYLEKVTDFIQSADDFVRQQISKNDKISIDDLIKATHLQLAEMHRFELNCGLQVIAPVLKDTGKFTPLQQASASFTLPEGDDLTETIQKYLTEISNLKLVTPKILSLHKISMKQYLSAQQRDHPLAFRVEKLKGMGLGRSNLTYFDDSMTSALLSTENEDCIFKLNYAGQVDKDDQQSLDYFRITYILKPKNGRPIEVTVKITDDKDQSVRYIREASIDVGNYNTKFLHEKVANSAYANTKFSEVAIERAKKLSRAVGAGELIALEVLPNYGIDNGTRMNTLGTINQILEAFKNPDNPDKAKLQSLDVVQLYNPKQVLVQIISNSAPIS